MLSVSGRQWQAGAPAPAVGGSNKRQRACSGRLALTAPVLTDPGLDLDGGLESACIHAALPEAPPAGLQVTMLVSTLFPWLWPCSQHQVRHGAADEHAGVGRSGPSGSGLWGKAVAGSRTASNQGLEHLDDLSRGFTSGHAPACQPASHAGL